MFFLAMKKQIAIGQVLTENKLLIMWLIIVDTKVNSWVTVKLNVKEHLKSF